MVSNTFNTDKNVCNAVLSVLQYYSLFQYPLKAEEIYGNMAMRSSLACLLVVVEDMESAGLIYKYDGYYSIDANVQQLVVKRKQANKLSLTKKRQAVNVGRFIFKFPFVKFVGISGSLSKGYADSDSNFDFFIVTAENRLWICRTFLHLFKKFTFLIGQQHKFCMNYFIDTYDLQIAEKNRFTAIELSSLIPVCGYCTYMQLKTANKWVDCYFPNEYFSFNNEKQTIFDKNSIAKT